MSLRTIRSGSFRPAVAVGAAAVVVAHHHPSAMSGEAGAGGALIGYWITRARDRRATAADAAECIRQIRALLDAGSALPPWVSESILLRIVDKAEGVTR